MPTSDSSVRAVAAFAAATAVSTAPDVAAAARERRSNVSARRLSKSPRSESDGGVDRRGDRRGDRSSVPLRRVLPRLRPILGLRGEGGELPVDGALERTHRRVERLRRRLRVRPALLPRGFERVPLRVLDRGALVPKRRLAVDAFGAERRLEGVRARAAGRRGSLGVVHARAKSVRHGDDRSERRAELALLRLDRECRGGARGGGGGGRRKGGGRTRGRRETRGGDAAPPGAKKRARVVVADELGTGVTRDDVVVVVVVVAVAVAARARRVARGEGRRATGGGVSDRGRVAASSRGRATARARRGRRRIPRRVAGAHSVAARGRARVRLLEVLHRHRERVRGPPDREPVVRGGGGVRHGPTRARTRAQDACAQRAGSGKTRAIMEPPPRSQQLQRSSSR